jgi:periplasmic protein TonB
MWELFGFVVEFLANVVGEWILRAVRGEWRPPDAPIRPPSTGRRLTRMTRRWWGGPGISVVLHAALFVMLLYVAAHPSQAAATAAALSTPLRFIYTVTAGVPGSGGGAETAAAPRAARLPASIPVATAAPPTLTNVDPRPVAAVPVITEQNVDVLPGAPMPLDGTTVGRGSGAGAGGGHGPGLGPGDGPNAGDVYTAGVGGVSDPTLVHEVKPNYTVDAMRAKIQGVVVMDVQVRADGTVDPDHIRITRSLDGGLDREAVTAVRQWRFRPSTLLGRAVASRVTVELAFRLR